MDRVLALGLAASAAATDDLAGDDRRLFDERLAARRAGDYKRSDELRAALEARGIRVKDTKDGARWERIKEGSAR
jgi:cysteinyl-tRNA synthetase